MKKIVALLMFAVLALCLCSCGEDGMSYEENEQFMKLEDELEQYHALDDYNILTDEDRADYYSAVAEKYGEDVAEDVVDMFFTNSHPLGSHID